MPTSTTPIPSNPETNHPPSLLHRLFLSLHLSHAAFPHYTSLLPTQTPTSIRALLLDLLKPTLPSAPTLTIPQLSAHLLRLLNGAPHTPTSHPPCTRRGRVVVRVTPATATDAFVIRKLNHNPNVEVVLRGARPLWDVIAHLFNKWDVPLSLATNHGPIRDVTIPVFHMVPKPGKKSIIYLQFSITYPEADVQKVMSLLRPEDTVKQGDTIGNRKRILAPKSEGGEKRQRVRTDQACAETVEVPQPPDWLFDADFTIFGNSRVGKKLPDGLEPPLDGNERFVGGGSGGLQGGEDVRVFDTKDLDVAPGNRGGDAGLALEGEEDELALEGEGGESDGEKAVMERLQVHLQKMKDCVGNAEAVQVDGTEKTQGRERVTEETTDSMRIPESFLRSGSGFEGSLMVKFPDSLFALNKSEGKENAVVVGQATNNVTQVDDGAVSTSLEFGDNARDGFEALPMGNWGNEMEASTGSVAAAEPAEAQSLSWSGLLKHMAET